MGLRLGQGMMAVATCEARARSGNDAAATCEAKARPGNDGRGYLWGKG